MNVGGAHLTYCTNIHAGETWAEVRANLAALHAGGQAAGVSPTGRSASACGCRISPRCALDVGELRAFLEAHDLYVFTINGFPYGSSTASP